MVSKIDYYELLEVPQDVTQDDLKSAYKKKALAWHPDKNRDRSEQAHQMFKAIHQAYSVLSDPRERAWYDSHKTQILTGKKAQGPELWQYFSTSAYPGGFSDQADGFFTIYRGLFQRMNRQQNSEAPKHKMKDRPSFGNSNTPGIQLKAFYQYWANFSSTREFAWADLYNPNQGPNRRVRRIIQAQNKKERVKQRKEFSETVRNLVDYLKKRDPRWVEYQQIVLQEKVAKQAQEELKRKENEEERKVIMEKFRAEQAQKYAREYQEMKSSEEQEEEEVQLFYCEICRKEFVKENQLKNHQQSKKHQQMKKKLLKEVLLEEELPPKPVKQKKINIKKQKEEKKQEIKREEVVMESHQSQTESDQDQDLIFTFQKRKKSEIEETKEEENNSKRRRRKNSQQEKTPIVEENNKKTRRKKKQPQQEAKTVVETPKMGKAKLKREKKRNKESVGFKCRVCSSDFPSKSKLFNHLKSSGHEKALSQIRSVISVIQQSMKNKKTFKEENLHWNSITYLSSNRAKTFIFSVLNLSSLGIFYLLQYWFVSLKVFKYDECNPSEAEAVFIVAKDKQESLQTVKNRSFSFRYQEFIYTENSAGFEPLEFKVDVSHNVLSQVARKGLSQQGYITQKSLFGPCQIDVPMPSILQLLTSQVVHPFFLFQIFSILLWFYEQYYLYSSAILFLSIGSLVSSLMQTVQNLKSVREMALYSCEVQVFRQKEWLSKSSIDLVPGDLIKVPYQIPLPCDSVLIEGSCLIDESMLTGQSQPVLKEAIPKNDLIFNKQKQNMLRAGTTSVSNQGDCLALVTGTGFMTAKGELVRQILYPRPTKFKFYSDSFKFVAAMGVIAVLGFLWCLTSFIEEGLDWVDILINSLDLVTIVVPPALPLAMTVGITVAVSRLKKQMVKCIAPSCMNAAGRVSVIAFDKTGTLTQDQMQLKGIWDAQSGGLQQCGEKLRENLAVCHSLSVLEKDLIGDPQEIAIFNSTKCQICNGEVKIDGSVCRVKKRYHFSSKEKRMGVVLDNEENTLHVKGAPEVILKACLSVSEGTYQTIQKYSQNGYRLLACAYKDLQDSDIFDSLGQFNNLQFLGLILLQNKLKSQTIPTIKRLQQADIQCLISTGDAVQTGVAVAKQAGLIKPFHKIYYGEIDSYYIKWSHPDWISETPNFSLALTGDLLQHLIQQSNPSLPIVLSKAKVFARMSPHQKILLIEALQQQDSIVAMVGDGANDCGALKAADVGISLSEAESSLAAPFTGKKLDDTQKVLKEGRASLVTSIQCFKFITMYSMIQFICVNSLFLLHNNMLDGQYLYQDLAIILPLAVFMAYIQASDELAKQLPPGALISVPVLSSIIGQIVLQTVGQTAAYGYLVTWDFYEKSETSVEQPAPSMENTVLFIVSSFQLIYICMSFSIGPPFRKSAVRNFWFCGTCVVLIAANLYFTLVPDWFSKEYLGLVKLPMGFKVSLVVIMGGCLLVTLVYEKLGVKAIEYIWKLGFN